MFSMQEASLDLSARRGIALESVINPTMLAEDTSSSALTTYFLSYANDSRLRVRSATGDIAMDSTRQRLAAFVGDDTVSGNDTVLTLLPPTVTFAATDGDIRVSGDALLAPSDSGQLELFAARDIYRNPTARSQCPMRRARKSRLCCRSPRSNRSSRR